jgi:hypothetical protein
LVSSDGRSSRQNHEQVLNAVGTQQPQKIAKVRG